MINDYFEGMLKPNHEKGKAYLKKAGTDVMQIAGGFKLVFSPGSAYEDINKEKLPEKFFIAELNKEYSFSESFKKHFKVTHKVDIERLLRACSILITEFTGPETEDYMRNHHKRLNMHIIMKSGNTCVDEFRAALVTFGEVLNIKGRPKITLDDYLDAARILGDYFKLWNYDSTIDDFFGSL